jgi:protein involved in polysaccharide export with SLBB domain
LQFLAVAGYLIAWLGVSKAACTIISSLDHSGDAMRTIVFTSTILVAMITCAVHASAAQTQTERAVLRGPVVTSESSKAPAASAKPEPKVNSEKLKSEARQYYKAGVKYGRARLFEQAASSFLLAIRLKPDYGDAYYGLGHAYFDLKRWNQSVEALEQAVEINPKDDEAYAMMGQAYLNSRRDPHTAASVPNIAPQGENVALAVPSVSTSTVRPANPDADGNILTTIYHVGAGDVLDVRLRNAPADQQTFFTVSANGLLEHPILSQPLNVIGITTEEIARRIESDLKTRAVNEHPQVLVGVREYSSHTVLVSGLVREPGTKVLRREAIPLYVVVADAQPLPEAGRAVVKSHQKGKAVVVDITDSKAMDLLVHPGNVITLERNAAQFFYVGGEVKAPGEKMFRPRLTLTQAILSAGGVNNKGKDAELARERVPGVLAVTTYKLKDVYAGKSPDAEVLPGDRITVKH